MNWTDIHRFVYALRHSDVSSETLKRLQLTFYPHEVSSLGLEAGVNVRNPITPGSTGSVMGVSYVVINYPNSFVDPGVA